MSDGIGIMNRGLMFDEEHHLKLDPDYEKHLVHNIEIFDNLIERNGEQGIWITSAKRGKVFRNKVIANAHRQGETGGSTGILLEGDVSEFDIFDNEVAWNDIFGIGIICSSNNTIRGTTSTTTVTVASAGRSKVTSRNGHPATMSLKGTRSTTIGWRRSLSGVTPWGRPS